MTNIKPEHHDIMNFIGLKLREIRTFRGVNQPSLADHLGISYQQIQKYETCEDKIPVSRLYEMSKFLKVPITCFFPDNSDHLFSDPSFNFGFRGMKYRQIKNLIKYYKNIDNEEVKKNLLNFIQSISKNH